MRRFYAPPENFSKQNIVLSLEETRHLRDVLRLRAGEIIQVFDGNGKEFSCEIETIGKKETVLKIIEEIAPSAPESSLNLTLAIALLKGEKFDLVIQKAVELGVSKIVPLITKRTDVKLKDSDKKIERWQRIILESSKQCGRAKLMEITQPINFAEFIKLSEGTKILFAERNGKDLTDFLFSEKIVGIVGSEGGWEDSELDLARENGVQIVTLGGRILRAETAGIVIPALLQNHFGDLK
ncbi:MAG: 16S rRNA (uracil(1498)-N(3))-methyltransferase [Pyrinomonadaceae bacterium]|nr:16S rRNA (uracil(1498)-N(3))-methyltransferase [Pyrinomonadaceae bacterium]